MTRFADLHFLLMGQCPGFSGITGFPDVGTKATWDGTQTKETEALAEKLIAEFDWTEKPEPTLTDVEIKLSRIDPKVKQDLIEQMLKQYLLTRPEILEKL